MLTVVVCGMTSCCALVGLKEEVRLAKVILELVCFLVSLIIVCLKSCECSNIVL